MRTTKHPRSSPSLDALVEVIKPALEANFTSSSISVSECPDLTKAPFGLAGAGLCGNESVSDVGGQPNLFPSPRLECKFSMIDIAKEMDMSPSRGFLLGAGAGPFHVLGQNAELAANLSWQESWDNSTNLTHFARIQSGKPDVQKSPSTDCALMINLYGSSGLPGPVLKVTAKGRSGSEKSFTECIRKALHASLGDDQPVSMGGVVLIKQGRAMYHIMPDFPPADQLPWTDRSQVNDWLTFHEFGAPMVCLTVFHSADPENLGLRMEHTHCFSPDGKNEGGHYHFDIAGEGVDDVEYEAYLNVAKTVYRIEKPEVTLQQDLHH
jgi:hypothetical protein